MFKILISFKTVKTKALLHETITFAENRANRPQSRFIYNTANMQITFIKAWLKK